MLCCSITYLVNQANVGRISRGSWNDAKSQENTHTSTGYIAALLWLMHLSDPTAVVDVARTDTTHKSMQYQTHWHATGLHLLQLAVFQSERCRARHRCEQ